VTGVFLYFEVDRKTCHYHDSEIYIRAALNMSQGIGNISQPYVGVGDQIPFSEHPPLWIFVQSLWYRALGNSTASINAFPATTLLLGALLVGIAAISMTGDRRPFFWAVLALVLNPAVAKWRHESLLDWGLLLAAALFIVLMVVMERRSPFITGFILGWPFGIALFAKGAFALVFLPALVLYGWQFTPRRRFFAGVLLTIVLLAGIWTVIDGDGWTLTRSIVSKNIVTQISGTPWNHIIPSLKLYSLRMAPWCIIAFAGFRPLWRRGGIARACYLMIVLSLAGFVVGGKQLEFYLLMIAPPTAFLAAIAMLHARPTVERYSRFILGILCIVFVSLRPILNLERPSNRAPEVREFLSEAKKVAPGPRTLGLHNCQSENMWYLLSYGWNQFGYDFEMVCRGGDEAAKYSRKLVLYMLPCSEVRDPEYLVVPETNWQALQEHGEIIFTIGELSLVHLARTIQGPTAP